MFLCLISYAPHQEKVWGIECIDPPFLTSYEMEMSFQPHAPAILLKGSKQHGRPLVKYKTIYTHTHLVTCIRQTQKMEATNISETWETSPTKTQYNPRIELISQVYLSLLNGMNRQAYFMETCSYVLVYALDSSSKKCLAHFRNFPHPELIYRHYYSKHILQF